MKKIPGWLFVCSVAALLAAFNTGCSSKAKLAYHLNKANKYFDAGDYAQAEVEYYNALHNGRENAMAIGRLGTIYYNQGRFLKAAPYLIKGSELATNDLDLHLKLASFYVEGGDLKKGHAEADFVLARRPLDEQAPLLLVAPTETPKALEITRQRFQVMSQKADSAALEIALGSIALRDRDFKTAEAAFQRAQNLNPKLSAVWTAWGGFYLSQTNLAQAENALKKAAEFSSARSQEKIQYAEFKMQGGDLPGGKAILEEMVKKTPDYIPAWMMLVKVALVEKEYDKCFDLLSKLLSHDPDNFNALLTGAQLKLSQGKIAEATVEFERMAKIYSLSPVVQYQLALACLASNETDKAIASLNKAVTFNTNFFEAMLLLDELEIKSGDAAPAIVSLNRLAQQYPQSSQVQMLLADALRMQGSVEDALKIYRQLETSYPTNFQIPLMMGSAFLEQKNNAEARRAFAKTLELAPDNFTALKQLVNLDMTENQPAAALQRVQAQLAKNPQSADLQILQAQVLMVQGDTKKAEGVLVKIIETQPDAEMAHMLLTRLYMDAKQNDRALAELKIVVAKNPKNIDALFLCGMIYDGQNNYKAAQDAYEKLLEINPKSSPALNNLAYLYSEHLNNLDRAYELAKRAKDLLPNDPSTGDTLGWVLCKRGQYSAAVDMLQESASQLPQEPEIQFHLGWALYMIGQENQAQQALQAAVQSGKEFRGLDECNQCLAVLKIDPRTADAAAVTRLEKRAAAQPADSIALLRLAAIYQRDGAMDKAMAAYESALKADNSKNAPALITLAQLYSAKKNPEKALDLAKVAYKLAPDNPQVSLVLGRLAYETGDYKLSFNLLQEAARSEPANPEVLFDFGKAAYAMGQVPDAEAALRNALQSGGAFSRAGEARQILDLIPLASNFSSAAAQTAKIEAVLKSEPDDVPALMALAGADEQKNDLSAARQTYAKVLNRYPDFSPAQKRLMILSSKSSEIDAAAYEVATKVRAAYPDDPEVAKAFGIILYQKADYTRAERILQESISTSPNDSALWYYLGMTQYHLKKTVECKKSIQKALASNDLNPQFVSEAKRVLTELK